MNKYLQLLVDSSPLFFKGVFTTLEVFFFASILSLISGLLMGICSCNRLRIPIISTALEFITFVLRGIPFYVQLLIVYFVLPDLIGCNLSPFIASVIALGFCSSGYVAQLARGALNSVPTAQWEAAFSLGYSTSESLFYIILPQMMRIILPSITNELDALLKSTSIVSTIGMLELTRIGMNIVSRVMEPLPIYLSIAVIYVSISAIINVFSKKLEHRLHYVRS